VYLIFLVLLVCSFAVDFLFVVDVVRTMLLLQCVLRGIHDKSKYQVSAKIIKGDIIIQQQVGT